MTRRIFQHEVIRFIDKLSGTGSLQEWLDLGIKRKFKVVLKQTKQS